MKKMLKTTTSQQWLANKEEANDNTKKERTKRQKQYSI